MISCFKSFSTNFSSLVIVIDDPPLKSIPKFNLVVNNDPTPTKIKIIVKVKQYFLKLTKSTFLKLSFLVFI